MSWRPTGQASGGVYGYRKITDDLRDMGERGGKNRVYRLMRIEGLRSQSGYHRLHQTDIAGHLEVMHI